MKKFLFVALLLLLVSPAFAGSIDVVRGAVYLPTHQDYTTLATAEATIWSDTTYLAPYINRVFAVRNPAGGATINATVEASMDLTYWTTQDATSLNQITAGSSKSVKITGNPYPYWRIRGSYAGTVYTLSSPESWTSMCTQ